MIIRRLIKLLGQYPPFLRGICIVWRKSCVLTELLQTFSEYCIRAKHIIHCNLMNVCAYENVLRICFEAETRRARWWLRGWKYVLISWRRSASQEIRFLWKEDIHYRAYSTPPQIHIMSRLNRLHDLSLRSVLMLSFHPLLSLSSDIFLSGFTIENLMHCSCSPWVVTLPSHILIWFP